MTLISCSECKREISNSAASCPHCGYVLNAVKQAPEKKMKGCFTWIFIIIVLLAIFYFYGKNNSNSLTDTPSTVSVKTSVENVRISKDYNNTWAVKGLIRNNSTHSIKGAVKIKFINSSGNIVYSTRARVNDGDSFNPGQSANFEYFTDSKTFNDVVDFKIEFYER